MSDTYETLVYRQKRALHYWKASLGDIALSLTPQVESTVWELLLLWIDEIIAPTHDTDSEVGRIATELANELLTTRTIDEVNRYFRDALVEAIMRSVPVTNETAVRMIHFTNQLSDAYREAYANRLRRMISRQRTTKLTEELQMAKRIQERLLPKTIPDIPGFDFAGRLIPAREVGGDYWSIKYYEDDGVVTLKLADITGHGIAAATLVAAVKFISGGYYRGSKSASEVIERTNRVLVHETPVEILVTMVYCWLYPETGLIDVVNAGHDPVFLCKKDLCIDIPPTGPLLGVTETEFDQVRLEIEPGDVLFFCSDGITEAGVGEPFGSGNIKDIVTSNRDKTANEIADLVIEKVQEYAGQSHDDMSLVVIKTRDK